MMPNEFEPSAPAEAVVTTSRRPSIVWLIPVVALVVGAFVAWKTWADLGPLITIDFASAEGLEAGKTKLKYKDVDVGVVEEIRLRDDLSGVVCTARMAKGAEVWLTEQTRFWVVKPRIAGGQVTGLGTLFSGSYVGVDPAREGGRARHFTGLETPPIVTMDQPGKHFVLRSHGTGAVDVGTPVYYRKIRVGEVVASELDASGEFVTVRIFVHSPHDERVREDTKFWNASGVHFSLSAAGVEVDVESVVSLLVGGIAFDTPLLESAGAPAADGAEYELYASRDATEREIYTQHTHYLLYFDQSVRGLAAGAPVEFRGIQIGEVQDVKLEYDPQAQRFRVPVLVAIEPQRIANLGGLDRESRREGMQRLVREEGLRAQLQSGNLLTGQLIVQLDTHEGVAPAEIAWSEPYPVFPTIATPLEEITSSVTRLVKKLEKMPLDQLTASVNATLGTARAALEQAERTLAAASGLVGPDSPVNQELRQALVELTEAARSIGLAADQIERQPDSILFGKGGAK
jgi:paraquat-inducible protein B